MSSPLQSLTILDHGKKAVWNGLKGSLRHTKDNFTRKLWEEIKNSEDLAPTSDGGPQARVELIRYNSYYGLFLTKAPILLSSFEAASEAMLAFLSGFDVNDLVEEAKIEACKKWIYDEEEKYNQSYPEMYNQALSTYLTHWAGEHTEAPVSTPGASGSQKLRNRIDLIPDPLSKVATPLEVENWLDKFQM